MPSPGRRDPPRLRESGIRVIMVTGDALEAAQAVARQAGMRDRACRAELLSADAAPDPSCDVSAEVLPERKFILVEALQNAGYVTGMTGDGVKDAPALKQAQVGIAVSSASDTAKAAGSMGLTKPGPEGILSAIRVSRQIT